MRIIIECPENILHLEAGYIYADCLFAQLQPSCSPAADHTFATVVRLDDPIRGIAGERLLPRQRNVGKKALNSRSTSASFDSGRR